MNLLTKYKFPIIGGTIALILALSLVTFGFFKTLFILILIALGLYLGYYAEQAGFVEQIQAILGLDEDSSEDNDN